ncbi:MAG: ABC transporter ATP-binding protein [Acidimicrobiales bacterium]|nr:ABC transporter ATP-binding protein [Acidimicrobiales bacterium]MDG2216473.1 ABC transporter ATP-binding protein [Acidimicrobiales bacterium]
MVNRGEQIDHMWRRGGRLIMRSLRAHPRQHATAMSGAVVFVFASIGGAWVLGRVTDDVVVAAFEDGAVDGSDVWVGMTAIVVISLLRGASVVVRRWFLAKAELRTQRDWRRSLVHHYLEVPLRFHRTRPAGELLAHADLDLTNATMVLKPLPFALSVVFLVIVALGSLLLIHPLLAMLGGVVFPLLVVMSQVYTSRVEAPSARAQQRVGDVSSVAYESFEGALVVKALGRETAEVERMREASARLRDERIHVGRMRANFEPAIDALPNVGVVLLLLVGANLVAQGEATPGDLVLAATLFGLLSTPLRVFGFFLEEMPRSVVSLDRVDRVMEAEAENRVGSRTLPTGALGLVVRDLSVVHDDQMALRDVDLDVAAGETIALVGPTGSGKSTLVEAVAGLLDRASGDVRLGDVSVDDVSAEDWSAAVALAFQESFLFADSVRENVSLGVVANNDARHALVTAQAAKFVDELESGFDTVVGERGTTLSGGQRQRVALARAIARRPRLLLLDDATSAVDATVESQILDGLRTDLDVTLIVVAHRISTILLADRVVYLDDGQVTAVGTHEELLMRPDYNALVTAYEQADDS